MASLMDMRELGMLRNATQQMESGGGIDMDEWRRRKRKEEEEELARQARRDKLERDLISGQNDPMLQEMLANATPGGVTGSLMNVAKGAGNVLKYVPYLRAINPLAKGTAAGARRVKRAVWQPGTKPRMRDGKIVKPGTSGSVRSWVAPTAITAAELGGVGHLYKDEISKFLGGTPEEEGPSIPNPKITPQAGGGGLPSTPPRIPGTINSLTRFDEEEFGSPKLPFNPNMLEAIRLGGAKHHEGMPTAEDKEKLGSPAANTFFETEDNTPSLWKTWGSLADNPKERRKAYLGSLKNIYMKSMMLDIVSKLTGGTSQGPAWSQMAIAELDAMEKFDSEERLHKQWKALFFREDGTYDPPKNRKEAIKRGQLLEYSLDQMKDILSIFPTKTDNRTNLEKNLELLDKQTPGSPRYLALERKILGASDDKTNIQKRVEYYKTLGFTDEEIAQAARYDAGIASRPTTETIKKPSIQQKIEYLVTEFNISDKDAKTVALIDAGLIGKEGTDKAFSARAKMLTIYLQRYSTYTGGIRPGAPTFDVWLKKPDVQKEFNALLFGVDNTNSSVIQGSLTEGDIDWEVNP